LPLRRRAKRAKTRQSNEAEESDRAQQKREAIDEMASMTLDRLLAESPQAKRLFGKSVGYAVFDNVKVALLVSAGGGVGVAIERSTRDKTYMKMGTAGIGLGAGGQSYNVVFLFEDEETLRSFVEKGWHADATATAAAGSKGSNAGRPSRTGGRCTSSRTRASWPRGLRHVGRRRAERPSGAPRARAVSAGRANEAPGIPSRRRGQTAVEAEDPDGERARRIACVESSRRG
jgi:hypothetical protein